MAGLPFTLMFDYPSYIGSIRHAAASCYYVGAARKGIAMLRTQTFQLSHSEKRLPNVLAASGTAALFSSWTDL